MNLYVSNGTVSLPKLYLLKSSLEKKNKEKNKQLLPPDEKQKRLQEKARHKNFGENNRFKEEHFASRIDTV